MQNVVDDVSLRPTAAGSTRTDTVVLLHLDSGAQEHKVYTGCVQAYALRSQCKFTSSDVTWSNLRASEVSRAAAFSTD